MDWFDIIKAYGSNTAKTNEQLMATLKEMGYDVNNHPMFAGQFNPAVANYIIQNEGKAVKRPIQQMGQNKPKPNLPKPIQKPITPKPTQTPVKQPLPSQKPPQLPASATRRSAFQNVLNQPNSTQASVNQPIKNNNVATTQSRTPLPANVRQQNIPLPQQQQQQQQQQQPQQPANAQQKKNLSDKVKGALKRRKQTKAIKRQGKNQKIVDRQRKEMVRMMTPEQRRQYQLEEVRQNPNKPVTQG
jgi:hypothetical protein